MIRSVPVFRALARGAAQLALIGIVALGSATAAEAARKANPKKVFFRFELRGFPEGSTCNARAARGKVRTGTRFGAPFVKVNGYAHEALIYCDLPDGRRIVTDLNRTMLSDMRNHGAELNVKPNGKAQGLVSTTYGVKSIRGFINDAFRFVPRD